jgi:hypothetical protein
MLTECRRLRDVAGPAVVPWPGSGAASPPIRALVFRENGLMAADDADQAGRLHAMIVT